MKSRFLSIAYTIHVSLFVLAASGAASAQSVYTSQSGSGVGHAPTQPATNNSIDYDQRRSDNRLSSGKALDDALYKDRQQLNEIKVALKDPNLTDDQRKALKTHKAEIEHDMVQLQQK